MTWIAMLLMEGCGSVRRRLKARRLQFGVGFLIGLAVLTTAASSGEGGGTCEVFISIDYHHREFSCVPIGQPLRVRLKFWTGAITGGTKATISAIHFFLDCSVPGFPLRLPSCKDDGKVVAYDGGDATITTDCPTGWFTGAATFPIGPPHPIGPFPNEVVFTANTPFDIPAFTGSFLLPFCELEFQTELLGFSHDSTPATVTQFAVISSNGGGVDCDNGVPVVARGQHSFQICPVVDIAIVLEPILRLPVEAFKTAAHRRVMVNILDEVDRLVAAVELAAAVEGLQNLVRHVDGCGSVPDAKSVPDANDWIVDCESQTAVRALLSGLIDTLDGFIDGPR